MEELGFSIKSLGFGSKENIAGLKLFHRSSRILEGRDRAKGNPPQLAGM
jgi:hypothetical protein